jgi:hypothetical protein
VTLFVLDTDHLSLYQRAAEPLLSKLLPRPPGELAITIITVEARRLEQLRTSRSIFVGNVILDEELGEKLTCTSPLLGAE